MTDTDEIAVPHYEGRPFGDSRHPARAQVIPGEINCSYFDLGGEGVAYHTEASVNGGSGALNPANGSYLNEFRMSEPVGTTYTKPEIDDTEFNAFNPEIGMLYVGWTASGQWLNYTVEIEQPGEYEIKVLYTAAVPAGSISLLIDGQVIGSIGSIPSMYDSRDPIDWRQVHHWAWTKPIVSSALKAGAHVLTLQLERAGHMNFAKIDFQLAGTGRYA